MSLDAQSTPAEQDITPTAPAPVRSAGNRRRAFDPARVAWLLIGCAAVAVLPQVLSSSNQSLAASSVLAAIGVLGINLIVGTAGQVSLAGAALLAVGAFTANIFVNNLSLPFPLPIICCGLTTAAVGLVLTGPALRLRGIYLALATIAFNFIVLDLAYVYQNGTVGVIGFLFQSPSIAGHIIDSPLGWYYVNVITLALVVLLLWNLMRSKYGRAWHAIRAAESGAEAAGVNVVYYKALAFGISSFCLGVAGALFAYNYLAVTSDNFPFTLAATQLAMVLVGGLGSMGGAVAGAVALTLLPSGIQSLVNNLPSWIPVKSALGTHVYQLTGVLQGLIIVVFVILIPGGLADLARRANRWARRQLERFSPRVAR